MAKDTTTQKAPAKTSDGFAPVRPLSQAGRGGALPLWPTDRVFPFFLAAHRSSWELRQTEAGWRLVPVLKRLIVQPGFYTTPAAKGQKVPDPSLLLSKSERMGFDVLRKNQDYVYEADGKNGTGYFALWEKVRVYDDGAFEIVVDHEQRVEFLMQAMKDGVLDKPRPGTLEEMRSRFQKHKSRARQRKDEEAMERADVEISGLEEAIKALASKEAA